MALVTSVSDLTILGGNTQTPKVFWKGIELSEVSGIQLIFDITPFVRLRVKNTTNFETQYSEMGLSGIIIVKAAL
jgi:hypothetical protein